MPTICRLRRRLGHSISAATSDGSCAAVTGQVPLAGTPPGVPSAHITARYLIVHEFIKRLHRRYLVAGIEIPFPVQTVIEAGGQAGHSYGGEPGRAVRNTGKPTSVSAANEMA
jgi:hypothetical protein